VAFDADLEDVRVAVDELRDLAHEARALAANDRPAELEVDDVVEDDAIADALHLVSGATFGRRALVVELERWAEVFGLRRAVGVVNDGHGRLAAREHRGAGRFSLAPMLTWRPAHNTCASSGRNAMSTA